MNQYGINTKAIIKRLRDHKFGRVKLTTSQKRAARMLLRKVLTQAQIKKALDKPDDQR